jgi:hypothetical protein
VKTLSMVVGAAILFTTAHVTVLATGGYGGSHAYITLAVAAGVAVASILVGRAWGEHRRTLAVGLVIAIAAGEALIGTAERLTAAREASQAPLRQAVEARQKLETRVAKAEAALAALPDASTRLQAAIQNKAAADAAVVTKSAERGCAANCRLLLQAQADQTQQEVEAARRDMAETRTRLEQAIVDAKSELAAFKAPPSPSPLADRIGWQAWVLDLVMAGLGSLSANGLACLMMVFGSHRRSENADTTKATETASEVAPAIVLEPLDQPQDFADAQSAKVVQLRPAGGSGKRRAKAVDKATPDPDAVQHGKSFMVARVTRADGDAATDVRALHRDYVTWCEARGVLPKPTAEIGPALLHLFELAKIPISQKDGKPIALGIALKS